MTNIKTYAYILFIALTGLLFFAFFCVYVGDIVFWLVETYPMYDTSIPGLGGI